MARRTRGLKVFGCTCDNNTMKLLLLVAVCVAGLYLVNSMQMNMEGYGTINTNSGMESTPLDIPFDKNYPPIKGNGNDTFILVHADWCGHCKKLLPTWSEFLSKSKTNGVSTNIPPAGDGTP